MKIDINKYRSNLPWIKNIFEKESSKSGFDRFKTSTDLSAVSHIPLIAILCFYGELYGFDEELSNQIDLVVKFYGYTQIDGKA